MYSSIHKINALLYADGSPVSIEIKNGLIDKITPLTEKPTGPLFYIGPGLFDNQVNGYGGIDFSEDNLSVEQVKTAVKGMWATGVTTFLPTLITNGHEELVRNFEILAQAREDEHVQLSIPGYHLEGPYISPLDGFRGAHPLEFVRKADWDEFSILQKAANGKILQVSLSPNSESDLEFVKTCRENGIVISLAHHNLSNEQLDAAINAGAQTSTHLGNGCENMIHRRHNILWPQLADDRLIATIICDGFHLTPEMIKTFIRAKTPDRVIATSDITHFAGREPGEHIINGQTFLLSPEGMPSLPAQGVLAGAALPLKTGIENILKHADCDMSDAFKMTCTNPAKLYGLDHVSGLNEGNRADLILFDYSDGEITIEQTILNGMVVYQKRKSN